MEVITGCVEQVSVSQLTFFLRRFWEGIFFPNFVERSILKLPLSKLCAVPPCLQNRALFEGEKRVKNVPGEGGKEGWAAKGAKRKEGRVKTGQTRSLKKGHNFGTLY